MTDKPTAAHEITFRNAAEEDFDRLVALKIAVQRSHLERVGRYTPERARERFRDGFSPDRTRLIFVGEAFAGCVTVHAQAAVTEVLHLYIAETFQGRGVGTQVMQKLMREAEDRGSTIRVTVLNHSPANAFYMRLGFVETGRDPIDVSYLWSP